MRTPPQIAVPRSAEAVTAEVQKLLRAADVRGQIPTPKSAILACAQLVETGELDLADYEETFSEKASDFFHKSMKKVLGFLDRRTRRIYIDPQLHDSRKTFVTYHEVVHRIAPWQHITYTEDDDLTLSLECSALFESEANYGAAEILFQCDRFETEARDYAVSIASALHLSQRYDASCHSSLRRFVERSHRPCLLLVLKPTSREHSDGKRSFFVSYPIPSTPFTLQFGEPLNLAFINPDHELGGILNNGSSGEIILPDLKGFSRSCNVECFSNKYHLFVLIHPKDDAPSRRMVLIRSS
jgi:Zn-dependent peptidase ImmA (M78 family)